MRAVTFLLTLLMLAGCAASQPSEDDYLTRIGFITVKEVVDPEASGAKRNVTTGVSASVSSGGGLSIGLGVLLGSMSSSSPAQPPVRYRVELKGSEQITVFHESDLFEVGDCVEIRLLPGDDEKPPQMKRLKQGCEDLASP